MSSQSKRVAALYLGAVFLAGIALGAVSHWFYAVKIAEADTPRPKTAIEYRQHMVMELDEELDLTPEQAEQVRVILDSIGERFHHIRDEVEPRFEDLRQERAEQLMVILTPQQQLTYQRILEERKARRKERHDSWWGTTK